MSDPESNPIPPFSSLSRSSFNLSIPSSSSAAPFTSPESPSHFPLPDNDDEIIPTAIVIKNIPFTVKREQLLAIIEDLMIPTPYAFNYHFDNGVFRGLAFANFRSAAEADAAVAGLNGFDVSGRKLRVEYKKVLQAGEKERIEKEKAIKRMRSMQLQKDLLLDQYQQHPSNYPPSSNQNHLLPLGVPPLIPRRPSQTILNPSYPPSQSPSSFQAAQHAFEQLSLGTSPSESLKPPKELDMNDPQTLELYSRVVVFKEDNLRDELAFAKSLSGSQRRIVHQIAKRLGLEHRSEGLGDDRFVVVSKPGAFANNNHLLQQQQQWSAPPVHRISRIASAANMNRTANSLHNTLQQTSNHHLYDPQSNLLRVKKSMPDIRSREMNKMPGPIGYHHAEPLPPKPLAGRLSHLNLRDRALSNEQPSMPTSTFFNVEEAFMNPSAGINSPNALSTSSGSAPILRHPRGPESCSGKGFASGMGSKLKNMHPIDHTGKSLSTSTGVSVMDRDALHEGDPNLHGLSLTPAHQ